MVSFETCMIGPSSQEHVLKLHESEIHFLEHIKSCVTARANADKEYSKTISSIAARAQRFEPVFKTPIIEVCIYSIYINHQ